MRVVVSTIVRRAPRGKDGYVYVADWERKTVLRRFQPPPAVNSDLGPRGGTRGYRGITFADSHCLIANNDSIFFYNSEWELTKTISHKWFSDIHEIESEGDAVWVVSTGIDAVLKCDLDGQILEEYFLGELPENIRTPLGIQERLIDRSLDHRRILHLAPTHSTHVNSVCIRAGKPYVMLYNQGAVLGLKPLEVVFHDLGLYGAHSARLVDGTALYIAQSYARSFTALDLTSGKVMSTVGVLPRSRDPRGRFGRIVQDAIANRGFMQSAVVKQGLKKFSRPLGRLAQKAPRWMSPAQEALPGWARGLAILNSDHVLVGSSPAGVALIDVTEKRLEEYLRLDDDESNSVFAVAVDPR